MTLDSICRHGVIDVSTKLAGGGRRPRDARLDFFRGVAMFIILIAHIPWNPWALWIPARFGFSDASEIFVFCSGMASALAFGAVFRDRSWIMGALRIAQRVWQIYWAHIGCFFAVLIVVMSADALLQDADYVGKLNLRHLMDRPQENLFGLFTLTYVPNFFDMLPMYIGILAMVPIVAGLAKIHKGLSASFVAATWLAATTGLIAMPAEPWSEREWFFNPFAWQLVFFTGFAFASGWLKPPRFDRRYAALAAGVVIVTVPFAWYMTLNASEALRDLYNAIEPLRSKTDFGVFRYIHFLAVAYLAFWAVGEGGRRLQATGAWAKVVDIIRLVGQQSLAVFVTSLVLAQFFGVVLDQIGRTIFTVAAVNLFGFCCLIATAWIVRWYKSEPWRKPAPAAVAASRAAPEAASLTDPAARPATS